MNGSEGSGASDLVVEVAILPFSVHCGAKDVCSVEGGFKQSGCVGWRSLKFQRGFSGNVLVALA